jgi:hypothetical protein
MPKPIREGKELQKFQIHSQRQGKCFWDCPSLLPTHLCMRECAWKRSPTCSSS